MMPQLLPYYLLLMVLLYITTIHAIRCRTAQQCDNCRTEVKEMQITRRMLVTYNGNEIQAECTANVDVNECDGVCLSNVAPSAEKFPGFEKECRCCREGNIRRREVILDACYDGALLLPGITPSTTIIEPINCSCQICRN